MYSSLGVKTSRGLKKYFKLVYSKDRASLIPLLVMLASASWVRIFMNRRDEKGSKYIKISKTCLAFISENTH